MPITERERVVDLTENEEEAVGVRETCDGRNTRRSELRVAHPAFVYHPVKGVLSFGIPERGGTMYHAIRFTDHAGAAKWIADGCVGELQEQLSNLCVCFTTAMWVPREY